MSPFSAGCWGQDIYNNRYKQREFKLKLSVLLKTYDKKYTELTQ